MLLLNTQGKGSVKAMLLIQKLLDQEREAFLSGNSSTIPFNGIKTYMQVF